MCTSLLYLKKEVIVVVVVVVSDIFSHNNKLKLQVIEMEKKINYKIN